MEIENEYTANAERYERLKAKLTLEASEVTEEELAHTVYENLINETSLNALPNDNVGVTYAYEFETTGVTAKAVFVNNKGKEAYYYTDADVCVIVATGDVYLQENFDGLIVTDGKVILDSGVNIIQPDKALVLKTLRQMESEEADAKSLIAKYFKDGDKYSMDTQLSTHASNTMDGQSLGDLIVYENWAKQ